MPPKPRSIEATRLEGDYLARLRSALRYVSESEATEIHDNVTEHIRAAVDELHSDEVSLSQMAAILEELGSPESLIVEPDEIETPVPDLFDSPADEPEIPPVPVSASASGAVEFLDRLFAGYLIAIAGLYVPFIDLYLCSIIGYGVIFLALKKAPTPEIAAGSPWALVALISIFSICPITLLSYASDAFGLLGLPAFLGLIVSDIILFWILFGGMADWIERRGLSELATKTRNLRMIYLVTSLLVAVVLLPVGMIAAVENNGNVPVVVGFALLPVGWVVGWFLVLRPIRRIRQAIG